MQCQAVAFAAAIMDESWRALSTIWPFSQDIANREVIRIEKIRIRGELKLFQPIMRHCSIKQSTYGRVRQAELLHSMMVSLTHPSEATTLGDVTEGGGDDICRGKNGNFCKLSDIER